METINVLVTMPFPESLMSKLATVSPRLNVMQREAKVAEDYSDITGEIDVLYASWRAETLPNPGEAPRLRWVQLHSAGIDQILEHPVYTESQIMITTTSGIHAIPMAEYTMAQVLAFAHHLPSMFEDKANATWPHGRWDRYVPGELRGATIGIVGYGSIGREIARLAQAFGMRVLAMKRNVRSVTDEAYSLPGLGDPEGDIPERIYPPEALRSFVSECDYVVLTTPLTPSTYHMIDAAALVAMKPGAVLINIARGDVVDEQALAAALEKGTIAGAALDVFSTEPLTPDSPLWKLTNTIISPHVSGFTPQYDERATDLFAENLRRFIAGESLLNLVDREHGY